MFLTLRFQKNISMKFRQFRFIIPLFVIAFLSSCLGTNDPVVYSDNPTFVSLTFAKNDSIPYLDSAVFTLERDGADSVIVNLDSLPYQTRIDSVYPTFTFKSDGGSILHFLDNSTKALTGADTIDFTQVVKIEHTAADLEHSRTYPIKVNVHQVEPELYVWNKVSDNLDSHDAVHQKAVYNDSICYFTNNNTESYVYVSPDGYNWKPEVTVTGLPANVAFKDLTVFDKKYYLTTGDNKIYSSSNGFSWSVQQLNNYSFKSLLFSLNDKLWAVVQSNSDNKKYFASSIDAGNWEVYLDKEVYSNFPVSDFTAHSFFSRTGKGKALVIGGKDSNGNTLHTNWNTEDGKSWFDFSVENKGLDTLSTGSSIISYDDKLLVFGLRNDKGSNKVFYYRMSKDQGLSWEIPDTTFTYNALPANYTPRNNISAVVFNPIIYNKKSSYTKEQMAKANRIFLLGGVGETGNLSDVWTGKLNRLGFVKQ